MKASWCRNERREDLAGGNRVVRTGRKKMLSLKSNCHYVVIRKSNLFSDGPRIMVRRVERPFALLEDLGSVPATSQGGLKNGTRSAVGHFPT